MFVFVQRALYFCKDVTRHDFADAVFLMYHSKIVEIKVENTSRHDLNFCISKSLRFSFSFIFLYLFEPQAFLTGI